jgi:hypothetical protein
MPMVKLSRSSSKRVSRPCSARPSAGMITSARNGGVPAIPGISRAPMLRTTLIKVGPGSAVPARCAFSQLRLAGEPALWCHLAVVGRGAGRR